MEGADCSDSQKEEQAVLLSSGVPRCRNAIEFQIGVVRIVNMRMRRILIVCRSVWAKWLGHGGPACSPLPILPRISRLQQLLAAVFEKFSSVDKSAAPLNFAAVQQRAHEAGRKVARLLCKQTASQPALSVRVSAPAVANPPVPLAALMSDGGCIQTRESERGPGVSRTCVEGDKNHGAVTNAASNIGS